MKRFLVAGVVMVMAIAVSAGTAWAQIVGGGVKGGVNFANVSGDDDDTSTRTGLLVGGFLTVPAGGTVAFQPEVLYSQQGAKFTEDGEDVTAEIDEVQIPLLLRLGGGAATSGAYFLTGPSIGFITSAKFKADGFEQDFKDELKSTDIGFLVGGGVNVSRFLIEARYTWGMTDLTEDDSDDVKSRVFSVLVGFGF